MEASEPRQEDTPGIDEITALTAELDAIDPGRTQPAPTRPERRAPLVQIGRIQDGGLAPAVAAIVERGVRRRPQLAPGELEVELKVEGPYPATRILFSGSKVLVEDAHAEAPQLRVEGPLTDLIHLMSAPVAVFGLPNPIRPHGRAALSKVATGRVRFEGPMALRRRLLQLLHV
ncbi:MAG: hypothetical protein J2O48_10830 [Solirubrobacterales bacterium]|nr:hypothetical protein [Solirubrobacterales bacterium]